MTASPPTTPTPIDVAQLYPRLSRRLEQIVSFEIDAPDPVIEDACQLAWSRLIRHADRVDPASVLSWLVCTAKRDAVKLLRREQRDASLEAVLESIGEAALKRCTPSLEELVGQRQRIGAVSALPSRQRRALWLHAAGQSYGEIAVLTGDTRRTVERQLLRARRNARALAA
jgi:RNA polymerase sigma factor (sigma-70 family)